MDSKQKSFLGVPIRTLSLIILLAFIAFGLFYIALKDINKKSAPKSTINSIDTTSPQTTLSISQNPITVASSSGSFYNLDVLIDTEQNNVNSVQLELSFDPNILKNMDVIPGTFISNPNILIKNVDAANGRISFAITPSDVPSVNGSGIIATLEFSLSRTQKVATSTAINFLPKTEARATGVATSVLKSTGNAIVILRPVSTPTPAIYLVPIGSNSATMSGR